MNESEGSEQRSERERRVLDWITKLTDLPERAAGSSSEREAASRIASWMQEFGVADVRTEPVSSRPRSGFALALHAGVAVLGLLFGGFRAPLLGAAGGGVVPRRAARARPLALAPAAGAGFLERGGLRAGRGAPAARVVLSAHIDAAQAGWLFARPLADFFASRAAGAHGGRGAPPPGPNALPEVLLLRPRSSPSPPGSARAAPAGSRARGARRRARSHGGAGPAVGHGALLARSQRQRLGRGGHAHLRRAAPRAAVRPTSRSGWSAPAPRRSAAAACTRCVESHPEWRSDRTFFVNFECVGGGALHWIRSEGTLGKTGYPPLLIELARRVAASGAFGEVTPTDLLAGHRRPRAGRITATRRSRSSPSKRTACRATITGRRTCPRPSTSRWWCVRPTSARPSPPARCAATRGRSRSSESEESARAGSFVRLPLPLARRRRAAHGGAYRGRLAGHVRRPPHPRRGGRGHRREHRSRPRGGGGGRRARHGRDHLVVPPFATPSRVALVERLRASWLPQGITRAIFASGGSESVDLALRVARQHHVCAGRAGPLEDDRPRALLPRHHAGDARRRRHTARRRPGSSRCSPRIRRRRPAIRCAAPRCRDAGGCTLACADAIEEIIVREGADTVAAVIAEPIGGSTAGALVPPDGYWPRLREITRRHGVLLIADEVMTGFGRTGREFARGSLRRRSRSPGRRQGPRRAATRRSAASMRRRRSWRRSPSAARR